MSDDRSLPLYNFPPLLAIFILWLAIGRQQQRRSSRLHCRSFSTARRDHRISEVMAACGQLKLKQANVHHYMSERLHCPSKLLHSVDDKSARYGTRYVRYDRDFNECTRFHPCDLTVYYMVYEYLMFTGLLRGLQSYGQVHTDSVISRFEMSRLRRPGPNILLISLSVYHFLSFFAVVVLFLFFLFGLLLLLSDSSAYLIIYISLKNWGFML